MLQTILFTCGEDSPRSDINVHVVIDGKRVESVALPRNFVPSLFHNASQDKPTHQRTLPKRKTCGVGNCLVRPRRIQSTTHSVETGIERAAPAILNEASAISNSWTCDGKTPKQIQKKVKQLTESRDQWKERCLDLERQAKAKAKTGQKEEESTDLRRSSIFEI